MVSVKVLDHRIAVQGCGFGKIGGSDCETAGVSLYGGADHRRYAKLVVADFVQE